ncbi:MFS transporter [Streptomyces sp. TRM66268-LWL]|uniref:MFS transporter n=1 Tax=Streptomyces polyasparticus TaxID=2767826 RepID=A0ABR7SHK1_9ACTN|nr:MFS transporter [Streptomyces polyasparticus]MBC9714990.1 MFS transporter [Streptomyces polyasparticus]
MRTYRELFAAPEFTPLFLASAGHVAGQTMSGLALGTLVHAATGSPLLTALAMFGPSLAQVLGATLLLSAADRLPPRAAMTGLAVLFAAGTAVQALPGMPVWGTFAVLLVLGTVGALGGGVRYGLVNEVLPKDGYVLGRSLLNTCAGSMQIAGFALGGLLVVTLSARGTLLVGAGLYLLAACAARFGLSRRPARAQGRPSVAQTWRTNSLLWSDRSRRRVYLALWLPNGLVVGAESLFVSYAPSQAGALFASAAGGMLLGDILIGRFVPPAVRRRLGVPLLLLLATPYLLFALNPSVPLAPALAALASVGFAASLVQQERLMSLTPPELSGQALGLHSSGMLTMQGVAATLAGSLAQLTSPAAAITVMAVLSLTVTTVLAPGLRTAAGRRGGDPGPRPGLGVAPVSDKA